MAARQILGRQRGFTLVEAIMAIVIIGILGGIVAVFIRAPIDGYVDTVARAEATDEADLALRRMARDIRLALPNSVRPVADGTGNGIGIEFLMTRTGGRYLSDEDEVADGDTLSFDDPLDLTFSMVGRLTQPILPGDFIAVFNMGVEGADAWTIPSTNMARVRADALPLPAGTDNPVIQLATNPFARAEPMPSPDQRFQVVSGPVSYQCEPENGGFVLRRYSNYPINPVAVARPAGARVAVLAARVANCENVFDTGNVQAGRAGLVILSLALRMRNDPNAVVRLVHQVQVDNTP